MIWGLVVVFVFLCGFLFYVCSLVGGVCFSVAGLGGIWFDFEFSLNFDLLSVVCSFMLLCCGIGALLYCGHYFCGLVGFSGLAGLMFLFLLVMFVLVISGSLVLSLVLWEYLGFVSFLLILYYSNMSSLRASIVTLVSSRFGDVGLFVFITGVLNDFDVLGWVVGISLFLVISSKSAGYPFMSWLLEAMRAPTPVSSLVHSSTLVAAGVWFMLRYGEFVGCFSLWLLFLSSCVTILLSACCGCNFLDVKKIVAFSTCNNISWCVLYLVCGDVVLAICQLLIHGLCKSLLFMSVGDSMSSSGGSQSVVGLSCLLDVSWYSCFLNLVLVSCLCGLPFFGVFFSKHVFLSGCLFSFSCLFVVFLFFAVFLSSVYCFRLFFLVAVGGNSLNNSYFSSFFLSSGLVYVSFGVGGWLYGFFDEVWSVGSVLSLLVLLVQGFGCFVGWFLSGSRATGLVLSSTIFGCDELVICFYELYRKVLGLLCVVLFRWECWAVGRVLGFSVSGVHEMFCLLVNWSWLVLGVIMIFCLVAVV